MAAVTSESGLRILAEVPAEISRRIAKQRQGDETAEPEEVAKRIVQGLNQGQVWSLAVSAVAANVAAYDRAQTREVEKAAMPKRRRERGVESGAIDAVRAEMGEVRALAERAALDVIVRLTPDLLDSTIRLGDGTEVAIGDATADQHAQRVDMLERHAQGSFDSLSRAIALINTLQSSGRRTLREVAT